MLPKRVKVERKPKTKVERTQTLKRLRGEPDTKTLYAAELSVDEYDRVLSRIVDDEGMSEQEARDALASHKVRVKYDGSTIEDITLVRGGGSRKTRRSKGRRRYTSRRR